jgi:hypothetical protein
MSVIVSWIGNFNNGVIHAPISTATRTISSTSAKTAAAPDGAGFAMIRATAAAIVNVGPEDSVAAAATTGMNMQSGENRVVAIYPGWAVAARTP